MIVNQEMTDYLSTIDNLNERQKEFCFYYINTNIAGKSYQKAYGSGMRTSIVRGCELLKEPEIMECLDGLRKIKMAQNMIGEEDIVAEMIALAFTDITDYVDWKTTLNDKGKAETELILKDSKDINGKAISEISSGKTGVRFKMYDKMRALEWLADRMDLIPTLDKEKLELEKAKHEKQSENESNIADALAKYFESE